MAKTTTPTNSISNLTKFRLRFSNHNPIIKKCAQTVTIGKADQPQYQNNFTSKMYQNSNVWVECLISLAKEVHKLIHLVVYQILKQT